MENWRGYMQESDKAALYGDLYLFEGDEISKTSFYDAINTLSESDDDADRFLENWQRSIDHMFEGLNESIPIETGVGVIDDAVLKASTQAYMALNKLKGKAVTPVVNLISKLDKVIKDNPKTSNAVLAIGTGLAVAAATMARIHLELDNSMDPEGLKSTMDTVATAIKQNLDTLEKSAETALQGLEPNSQGTTNLEPIAPRFSVDQWGNEAGSPEYIEKLNQNLDNVNNKISNAIQNPELEQAMSKYEDGVQSQWGDLLAQADADRGARGAGAGLEAWSDGAKGTAEEFMYKRHMGYQPGDLQSFARAIEDGQFDGENRKYLKTVLKYMPQGEEKKQLRGFIRARDLGFGNLSKLGKSLEE